MEFIGFFKEQYQIMFGPKDSWQVNTCPKLKLQPSLAGGNGPS